jgi:hypothetical protein
MEREMKEGGIVKTIRPKGAGTNLKQSLHFRGWRTYTPQNHLSIFKLPLYSRFHTHITKCTQNTFFRWNLLNISKESFFVRLQVLMVVTMKIIVFRDLAPCSLVGLY